MAAPAFAGPDPTVTVKDNKFKPDVAVQVYDGVTTWDWRDDVQREHNVRQDAKLFYSGDPTSSTATTFSVPVSAGTFHYYCEVHGSKRGGMDGLVKVRPYVSTTTPEFARIIWGNGTVAGDQWDVRYRVGKRKFRTWQNNTPDQQGDFGAGDVPVNLTPGKTYTIQARTELSSDPSRRSGWSPKLVLKP